MSASVATGATPAAERPAGSLQEQTVVVIGASAGIGFETAKLARAEGAEVILTARNPDPLERAGRTLGALRTEAFDAGDNAALDRFFASLEAPVDHILVTAGRPAYGSLAELGTDAVRAALSEHQLLALAVARHASERVRPGGALLLMSGTGGRRAFAGGAIAGAVTAATPALARALALEIAPVRVNVIAPGFVDTPLSAAILGEALEARRAELRATLPIGRVVGAEDVAALAVHLMLNTALTGATYDVDGGQQLLA